MAEPNYSNNFQKESSLKLGVNAQSKISKTVLAVGQWIKEGIVFVDSFSAKSSIEVLMILTFSSGFS